MGGKVKLEPIYEKWVVNLVSYEYYEDFYKFSFKNKEDVEAFLSGKTVRQISGAESHLPNAAYNITYIGREVRYDYKYED